MPIGALTMIIANVGLSIFNNWAASRQSTQIACKREEFEKAAREGQRERMLQLMREGQELTLQLEEQKHQDRIQEINDQFDNLIKELAYSAAIDHWPLKTLPVVMKNQALGNLLAKQEEKVALHCILTPSNCSEFNRSVYSKIESALEEFCNVHWSCISSSPILFYSGAWNFNDVPSDAQLSSLRTSLSSLPTLLISPYFRPTDNKLVFQVSLWGVGSSSQDRFDVSEIVPDKFRRVYTGDLNWIADKDVVNQSVEDIVPYLQCLIGYIADTYFWSAFGTTPQLPRMLTDGTVTTDGLKDLSAEIQEDYEKVALADETDSIKQPFKSTNALALYDGISYFYKDDVQKKKLEALFKSYCSKRSTDELRTMEECLDVDNFTKEDLPFIRKFRSLYKYDDHQKALEDIQEILEAVDFDYSILDSTDVPYLEKLSNEGNAAAMFRLGEIYEYSIGVGQYDETKSNLYYNKSLALNFLLAGIYSLVHDETVDTVRMFSSKELYVLNFFHRNNIVSASLLLSQYYFYGPDKDRKKVFSYIEEAPDTNHSGLFFWAGKILLDYCAKSELPSIEYNIRKSADLGYIKAQLYLMYNYQKGGLFTEHPSDSFKYAQIAAEQGSVIAIGKVGFFLFVGYGCCKNRDRGLDLIKIAARKGDRNSLDVLNKI